MDVVFLLWQVGLIANVKLHFFLCSYRLADSKTFYELKIGPLLAEIQLVLYRKVKFYIIAIKTSTQYMSVYFFFLTDLPNGNNGNRGKMLVLVIFFILYFRPTDFTKKAQEKSAIQWSNQLCPYQIGWLWNIIWKKSHSLSFSDQLQQCAHPIVCHSRGVWSDHTNTSCKDHVWYIYQTQWERYWPFPEQWWYHYAMVIKNLSQERPEMDWWGFAVVILSRIK